MTTVDDRSGTGPANKPGVLVVEDDRDSQRYMKALLSARFEVFTASSADEAREQLSHNVGAVHVILMDFSLHGSEDGLALTRSLRALENWKTVPIIATTAHAFPEDRERALQAGCNAYLAKPFTRRELLAAIDRLLTP